MRLALEYEKDVSLNVSVVYEEFSPGRTLKFLFNVVLTDFIEIHLSFDVRIGWFQNFCCVLGST